MQHGTDKYHAFVGAALARSIHELVRTGRVQRHPELGQQKSVGKICITPWGRSEDDKPDPVACGQMFTNGELDAYYRLCSAVKDAAINMSGFEFGSVFGREDKMSVHSNAVFS